MASRAPIDVQLGGPILQTSTDVPAFEPTPQTGFLDNLRATRDEMLLAGNTNAQSENERSAYMPLVDALEGSGFRLANGRHVLNPGDLPDEGQPTQYGAIPSRGETKAAIFDEIRRRRVTERDFLPGVPDTPEAFDRQVNQRNGAKLQRVREVQAGATGWGEVGGFAGGVLGSFQDPVNLWTMPFGGPSKTVVGAFARSAIENMLVETISQPFVRQNYAALGQDMTLGDSVRQVLFAGGAGGLFGATTKAIGRTFHGAGPAYDAFAAKVFEGMPESVRERWAKAATIDDRLVADTFRAAVPEERWTSEQRDALNVVERDADVREASPFTATPEGDDAHATALSQAMQRLIDADRPAGVSAAASLRSSTSPLATPPPRAAGPAISRDETIRFVMHGLEGGAAVVNYNDADGGTTKFGIAAKFNRGVNVGKLTEAQAAEIYKRDYWFAGLDQAPPSTAAVAFDAGVIAGPKVGQRILAASGGDAERAIALYRAHLNHIADQVPGKAKYREGWNNRVDRLARKLGLAGDGRAEPIAELAGLGETRAVQELDAEGLAMAREAGRAADAELGREPREGARFEPAPVLRRELFASDDDWLEAQVRLWRDQGGEISPEAVVEAPPAREAAAAAAIQRPAPAVAPERAAGEPTPITAATFVDAYMRGEGRGDSPRDRQLQEFQFDNGPAVEAEFTRRAAAADPARPLTREELERIMPDGRAPNGKRDPLWLLGLNDVDNRSIGREPKGGWVLRDKATGEVATWSVDKRAIERERVKQWEPGAFDVERLHPENVAIELRARAMRNAAEAGDVELASPALERFSDPDGEGPKVQAESLEHDLRAEAESPPAPEDRRGADGGRDGSPDQGENDNRAYRTGEEGPAQTLGQILDEIDREESAWAALKACL